MSDFSIEGKVKLINPEQQVSATYKKREIVITSQEQYPQHILVEFSQDKCDLLNHYKVGQNVKVSINIMGREWLSPQGETKYFNSIKGWRIEKMDEAPVETHTAEPYDESDDSSDLPF